MWNNFDIKEIKFNHLFLTETGEYAILQNDYTLIHSMIFT